MNRHVLIFSLFFLSGIVFGKYAIQHTQKRSFLACSIPLTTIPLPKTVIHTQLPSYPWEAAHKENISPITKEYFRCKGFTLNPPLPIMKQGQLIENIFDCRGTHSLPIKHNQEHIYPILIKLLNEIQRKTTKPVIITSGHRCPQHNRYVDPSMNNRGSKHQIGAEVAFYVAGLENEPEKILDIIFQFYQSHPHYTAEKSSYCVFQRYEKTTNVRTAPWFNKEIFVKLFLPDEGRNAENTHPFPYISIQVRFDQDTNMRVIYSEKEAKCLYHY